MRHLFRFSFILYFAACNLNKTPEAEALDLVIAASLIPAASELSTQIEKSLGVKLRIHSGASSMVARQIVKGLPCDVVILADTEWMDFLLKNNSVDPSSVSPLLGNQLVLISLKSETKLQSAKRIAIADPTHVPAGKYAKTALKTLGIYDELEKRFVTAPDVRTALLWVERGEADAGIVYTSDAKSSKKVNIVQFFEENAQHPIRYPVARCISGKKGAQALYEFLTGKEQAPAYIKFGFQPMATKNERT